METLLKEILEDQEREGMRKYLINFFRREEKDISTEEKINFAAFIINNRNIIIELEEFYEEECQLAIINWVFYNRKQFEVEGHYLLEALLYNLIIILEIFPIKTSDFISLKIVEKLNSIRRSVRNTKKELSCRIEELLSYWKNSIVEMRKITYEDHLLNKKRLREEDDEEKFENIPSIGIQKNLIHEVSLLDSINNQMETSSDLDSYDTKCSDKIISKNKINKGKKVKWRENIVEEIFFNLDNSQ